MLSSAAACAAAALKQAEEPKPQAPPSHFHASAELTFVSDYRRGGATRSDGNPALQGRIDVRHDSGWSAGVFATSMHGRRGSNAEIDLFGARRFEFGDTDVSLSATYVIFLEGGADPFAVAQASVSHPIGPIDATLAVSYAPAQAALDNDDGMYVALRARTPIGSVNGAPITLGASVGRATGEFAMNAESKLDWSAGATVEIEGVELGLAYVDNDLDGERGEAGLVFSISHRF